MMLGGLPGKTCSIVSRPGYCLHCTMMLHEGGGHVGQSASCVFIIGLLRLSGVSYARLHEGACRGTTSVSVSVSVSSS